MKKFSKILALALAVAMMLGMTAMAGTLYLTEDFDYASFDAWRAAVPLWDGVTSSGDIEGRFNLLDFEALRAAGTKALITHTYGLTNASVSIIPNSNGNNMVSATNTSYAQSVAYIPSLSWDIANNPTEKYVISYDIAAPVAGVGQAGRSYQYVHGVSDTGALVKTQIVTAADAKLVANTSGMYSGTELVFEDDTARRFAHGFYYDTAEGTVVKVAADNGIFGSSGSYQAEGLTTIDAFVYNIHNNATRIAKLRMYTIDATTGLVGTSTINGTTGVATTTNKVTIVFNQPVGAANVAVTSDGVPVNGVTTDIREIISGNSITSEVDVMFAGNLDLGATYSIDLSNVTNEIGDTCVSAPITFETLSGPSTQVELFEGLTEGTAIDIADAAGKTVYVKATATNNSTSAANGKIFIGIYDAQGNIVKYVSSSKTIAGSGTATFGASFKLAAGQTVSASFK